MNRGMFSGRLTRDPVMSYTSEGVAYTSFGIAVVRYVRRDAAGQREEVTDFFEVKAWNGARSKLAELCATYLKKGERVLVEGRVENDEWESNGERRSRVLITAREVEFLEPKASAQAAAHPVGVPPQVQRAVEGAAIPAAAESSPAPPAAVAKPPARPNISVVEDDAAADLDDPFGSGGDLVDPEDVPI